ncbi:MAG TPA: beta-propeller domain-containing protein [Micromonosporaceae bacterium]|nr:beta-propeller domain-containing protein [Micromonosporaceae bacterium]
MTSSRLAVGGVVLAAGLALSAGCTADSAQSGFRDAAVPLGSFQLVAFTSCDDALGKLKQAAKEYIGPYGFGSGGRAVDLGGGFARDGAVPPAAAAEGGKSNAEPGPSTGGVPNYSGTNTHEAGVDEPDLVKTDGRRIVTVSGGVLRVIDASAKQVTGSLDLRQDRNDPLIWSGADLLLAGDRALVLINGGYFVQRPGVIIDDGPVADPAQFAGPRLLLVDLAGSPRVIGSYTVDGNLVDARQVGATVRVVVRSFPRVQFPYNDKLTDAQRLAANKAIIDKAGPDEWLPRYSTTTGGRTSTGRVDCRAVSRPAVYSGTSMVTVLSFDLGRDSLGTGEPVTIVADGNTVYSNGPSLYIANDQQWRVVMFAPDVRGGGGAQQGMPEERTELYKFDTSGSGRPRYVASGTVPGYLINQYAMSEWDGHLRVATTTGQAWGRDAKSSSAVYVLNQHGRALQEVGKVTGLGKGERIYAVRFTGPVGYVVTFRQTDPLYTVDLSDPAHPRTTGELKITGYSAYLHPVSGNRLIGIGQEANQQGRVQGTQVSLFDVSDLTKPSRIAQFHAKFGHSEAEFDPHAFLYWPASGMLVVPLNVYEPAKGPQGGALVLQVSDGGITEVGFITHPEVGTQQVSKFPGQIRRSLVIDDVLWTVSDAGLEAASIRGLGTLAWVPLT